MGLSNRCRATHVPVGEDQRQHLEFARECVTNFNHAYGADLAPPETILCELLTEGEPTAFLTDHQTDV